MSFKENLLKKIKIDQMTKKIIASMTPSESGSKLDRETLREMLDMGPRKFRKERDLDLYLLESGREQILVLDNELAMYHTTPEDVAMRKSPTLKEMLSIRNAIKILKDSDVVVSRREESLKTVQKECIDQLDLSFDKANLDEIETDGLVSLEKEYPEGVIECLTLFGELLAYRPPPKAFRMSHHKIIGQLLPGEAGQSLFGPLVIYSMIHNSLKLIDAQMNSGDKGKAEFVHQVASGKEAADMEGPDVLGHLKAAVIRRCDEGAGLSDRFGMTAFPDAI